jgi:hypothetical protein
MNETEVTAPPQMKTGASLPRWFPRGRSALLWLGIPAIGAGLVFGWDWLVAAGFAPIIVSVLPCVAMCALGLCAMRGGAKSSRDDEKAAPKAEEQAVSPPQVQREP